MKWRGGTHSGRALWQDQNPDIEDHADEGRRSRGNDFAADRDLGGRANLQKRGHNWSAWHHRKWSREAASDGSQTSVAGKQFSF